QEVRREAGGREHHRRHSCHREYEVPRDVELPEARGRVRQNEDRVELPRHDQPPTRPAWHGARPFPPRWGGPTTRSVDEFAEWPEKGPETIIRRSWPSTPRALFVAICVPRNRAAIGPRSVTGPSGAARKRHRALLRATLRVRPEAGVPSDAGRCRGSDRSAPR